MGLSNDLISQFVKATNDDKPKSTEDTVYGMVTMVDGRPWVKLDGSDRLTPADTTTAVTDGERVTVLVKNHTATITGNISSPSAKNSDVEAINQTIAEFDTIIADQIDAKTANIESAIITNLDGKYATFESLEAAEADIDKLQADNVVINEKITARDAEIDQIKANSLSVEVADAKYATIENLEGTNAKFNNLESTYGEFVDLTTDKFEAIEGAIQDLDVESLNARYANIDFSNIGQAAMENFYANSGLIKNVVVGDQTITGELVGVTIRGDRIIGGSIVADKLVIKGSDGIYYKLNAEGGATPDQLATEEFKNGLHGSNIIANSITAEKIKVDDLVAFGAKIGNFNIGSNSIYSGAKASVDNTTRGIYMDTNGQVNVGDSNNYLKFYKDQNGNYKLDISASSLKFGTSGKNVEQAINDIETDVSNAQSTANSAQSTANTAVSNASAAQTAANKAQSTADMAKANAATAQTTADTAKTNAATAQTAADKAQADVNALTTKVTSAETKIEQNSEQIALRATKTEVANTLVGYYTKSETDSVIEQKADSIKTEVSTQFDDAKTTDSASGSFITLTDSSDGGLIDLNIEGKMTQFTTTGAQLVKIPDVSNDVANGVTWNSSNGVVTVKGTTTAQYTSRLYCDVPIEAGTYSVSGSSGGITVYVIIVRSGTTYYYNDCYFTLDGTETTARCYCQINNNGATVNATVRPMVNKGSTPLPWEPYTGRIASPNPYYPQDPVSIGNSGSFNTTILGKNICSFSVTTGSGVYARIINFSDRTAIKKGQVYTASVTLTATAQTEAYWNSENKIFPSYHFFTVYEGTHRYTYTFTAIADGTDADTSYAVMNAGSKNTATITASNVQIELGPVATDYEPFDKQSLMIPYTLRRVGEVIDEIDFARGVFIQRVGTTTYKGTEGCMYDSDRGRFYKYGSTGFSSIHGYIKKSTHYTNGETGVDGKDFTFNVDGNAVYFKDTRFTNAADFNNWLTTNNVTIIAPLVTPIEIPLTAEELAAYAALHTNDPITNIFADGSPELYVEYFRNTEEGAALAKKAASIQVTSDKISSTVKTIADSNRASIIDAESNIEQLSNQISTLVQDGSGKSLMVQTSTGWTFSMGNFEDALNNLLSHIVIGTYNGQPCLELTVDGSKQRLMLTNTDIRFMESNTTAAYITGDTMNIDNATVDNKFSINGYEWSRDSDDTLNLVFK